MHSLLLLPVPFLIDEIVTLNLLYYGEKRIKRIQLVGKPVDTSLFPDATCSVCQLKYGTISECNDAELEDIENFCMNVESHVVHPSCLLPWWLRIGPANARCPECRGLLYMRIRIRPLSETENIHFTKEAKEWLMHARKCMCSHRREVLTRAIRLTFWISVTWVWIIARYAIKAIKRKQ